MDYIIVTICCGDIDEDLKVPAFAAVCELICIFNEIYDADGQTLHAQPKGIILDKNKTLAQQGVEHGAKLTLH